MALLDEAACANIETAITEVERATSSEIVVAEVSASDDYTDLALAYGTALALASAAAVHVVAPGVEVTRLLWLEAAIVLASMLAFRSGAVLRVLVPKQRLAESVERCARELFFERRLFATREHTGVLILVSALEHRVAILGDSGIDQYVKPSGWSVHVQRMTQAIRQGRAAEGICEVTRAIGLVLAQHLPKRDDDIDELPNQVRSQ